MDLIFQTNRGNLLFIEVGYFDTILEIKQKIQKDYGIPVSTQTLIFNDIILPDELNVHHTDILNGSQIHLVVAENHLMKAADEFLLLSKIHLLLKMPSSKVVVVKMDVKDTIQKLKEKIHENEGIPVARLIIHANGTELNNDHKTIHDYELLDNSEVTVAVRAPPIMATSRSLPANMSGSGKVRVLVLYGGADQKIPVEMNLFDTVGELKKKLQRMNLDLPSEGYFFIYKQNVMDDDRSFRWHHVGHGDTIEIFSGSVSGGS